MKDKLLAQLRKQYAGKGLSDKALNAIADRLVKSVTEENQIEAAVTGEEDTVNLLQSETDAARTAAKKAAEGKAEGNGGQGGTQNQPEGGTGANANNGGQGNETVPTWAQPLIDGYAKMQKDFLDLQTGNVTSTRLAQVTKKLEGVPDTEKVKILKAYNRMKFDTPEEFEDYMTNDLTPDAQALIQKQATDGLTQQHRPLGGTGSTTGTTVADQIKTWANKGKPPVVAVTATQ